MRIERRNTDRELLDFLGENLAGIWTANINIRFRKKCAKVFRICEDKKKFGALI